MTAMGPDGATGREWSDSAPVSGEEGLKPGGGESARGALGPEGRSDHTAEGSFK